jgi:hypothetical protein
MVYYIFKIITLMITILHSTGRAMNVTFFLMLMVSKTAPAECFELDADEVWELVSEMWELLTDITEGIGQILEALVAVAQAAFRRIWTEESLMFSGLCQPPLHTEESASNDSAPRFNTLEPPGCFFIFHILFVEVLDKKWNEV